MSAAFFKYGQQASASDYRKQGASGQTPQNNAPAPQPGMQPQVVQPQPRNHSGTSPNAAPTHSSYSQPANTVPQPSPSSAGDNYISKKIYKVNGKDKVVDFASRLSVAQVQDFANVHGCGGKGHAANSTVCVTICDYSKGKGDKSVTTSFNLEVEQMDVLHQAAMDARLGKLTAASDAVRNAAMIVLNDLCRWEAASMQNPVAAVPVSEVTASGMTVSNAVKSNNPTEIQTASNVVLNDLRRWQGNVKRLPMAAVPMQEISAAKNSLAAALNTNGVPLYEYSAEKNDPYKKNSQGYVPVSKIYIAYTPTRQDGSVSRYPWLIRIENFDAPLNTRQNGASSHDASKAVNKKMASINLSADDFAFAMVAVKRFIRLWEIAMALPVVRKALGIIADIRARKDAGRRAA